MSTELVERLREAEQHIATLMSEQLAALTKRATAAEAANTALTAKVALLTEALATDRLAVIEECAKVADSVAKVIKSNGWPQYAAQQCATAIRALSEPDKDAT